MGRRKPLAVFYTNGFIAGYWYDAAGERVIKTSGDDEGIYVNDVFSGGRTETADFTAYINPYLVVSKGGSYAKHIYIGSQRIVSKLGDLDSYGQDPRRIEYAGSNVDGAKVDYDAKYAQSQQAIKDNYANFEVPYYGTDNDDYVNGEGFCCTDTKRLKSFDPGKNDNPELFQYYYHSDHLGSSSLITNLDGEVVQHVEYVPFGEVFIEERNNTWNTPYLFNGKELDEETGNYYYSKRYYDPRISIFYGVDPLVEKTGTPYQYCYQNPVKFIDPTGMEGEPGALYTNTNNARGVIEKGFKGAEYGKYSSSNWFSTTPNAGGTGRAGQGVTLTVEGINTSNSIEITSKQMKSFYEAAKQELGYTSEQLRNNPALRSEVDGLKYSKLGKWMDETGAAVYKLGDSYAVSDAAANKGTIKAMNGNSSLIKSLNGTKIAGRSLVVIAAGLDAYEIYTSENRARTITSVVGGWTGAWAGATLGAEGGAIIGAACGAPAAGVGAAPGAVVGAGIGSLIGGVAGYFVGREITETVYDLVTTSGFKIGGK